MARLRDTYREDIAPALAEQFSYDSVMETPRLDKIVVSMGVGEAIQDPKALESAVNELMAIAGQKPVVTHAKKSVANFKVRQGMAIGCAVTLRGERMYDFLDKLFNVALPRVRDFRGLSPNSFDGRGNYSLGVREQLIFPEIDYDDIESIRGMNITIVTTAGTDEEAFTLLSMLGAPFKK